MKLNIKLFPILIVFFVNTSIAQTTAIPDQNFEQALIDLGIDSDGVVNGQVLTADVENIVELDFSNLYLSMETNAYNGGIIEDFTGIEAFTSLEILNISNLWTNLSGSTTDVFNSNFSLREFIADNLSVDTSPDLILSDLDFSNLPNLGYISLYNKLDTSIINLKNPSIIRTNLTINLNHEYWDPPSTYPICINVNDAQAANANAFPYNTWNVITQGLDSNGYAYVPVYFSSTCTLSTSDFDLKEGISIYPNPVKNILWIENPNQIQLKSVNVFTMQGKLVKSFADVKDNLSLSELKSGLYFVKINDTASFKIIKE